MPKPDTPIRTPTFEVSDQTAAIKARRLMKALWADTSEESLNRREKEIGLFSKSNTKRWRAVLRFPLRGKNVNGSWFNKAGEVMEKPDPKKTETVFITMLESGTFPGIIDGVECHVEGLFLVSQKYKRSHVLNPRQNIEIPGKSECLLQITFHALQRLIQRGFGLSFNGEIDHKVLIMLLFIVWNVALERHKKQKEFPATFKVEESGATFVVKAESYTTTMTLVTMYSDNKKTDLIGDSKSSV
jgi:hypothetical protein